ncbi:MAG: SH3 domain-containing protein [Actinobacteria bacterium]|nr:SH3 domain-containing protein [Actinomycetota bacterium]
MDPTHRVPEGGLPGRPAPDLLTEVTGELAAGTEVRVLEQRETWALVMTDSGLTAWVDGARLEPLDPAADPAPSLAEASPAPSDPVAEPAARRGKKKLAVVALVAVVVAAGVGVAFAVGGDDDGDAKVATRTADTEPAPLKIALTAPEGWTQSDDRLAVAKDPADFDRLATPAGPVAYVDDEPDERTPAEIVEQDFAIPEGASAPRQVNSLVGDVEELEIDGETAVAVTMETVTPNPDGTTEGAPGWIFRYVTVHPKDAPPVVFVLVAPREQFAAVEADLDTIPGFSRTAGVAIPGTK